MIKDIKDIRFTLEYQSKDIYKVKQRLGSMEDKISRIEELIRSAEGNLAAARNFAEESPADARRQIYEVEDTLIKIKECFK